LEKRIYRNQFIINAFQFDNNVVVNRKIIGGGEIVTVASQVKTCVASLKSAQASLEQFALETQNQEAKTLFTNCAGQTNQILTQLQSRVQQLENEEPQYKGF
jgi:hypothetical protein